MSLPTRGAWIETNQVFADFYFKTSLPTRGAWIETNDQNRPERWGAVAPHTGSVD